MYMYGFVLSFNGLQWTRLGLILLMGQMGLFPKPKFIYQLEHVIHSTPITPLSTSRSYNGCEPNNYLQAKRDTIKLFHYKLLNFVNKKSMNL